MAAKPPDLQEVRAQRFVLTDAEGNERAILGTTPDGATKLTFLDRKRGLEIGMRRASDGDLVSELIFWDDGRERLYLGIGCQRDNESVGVVLFDVDEDGQGQEVVRARRPEPSSERPIVEERPTTPEDTVREAALSAAGAGISTRRQSKYQRRMSTMLAGRA